MLENPCLWFKYVKNASVLFLLRKIGSVVQRSTEVNRWYFSIDANKNDVKKNLVSKVNRLRTIQNLDVILKRLLWKAKCEILYRTSSSVKQIINESKMGVCVFEMKSSVTSFLLLDVVEFKSKENKTLKFARCWYLHSARNRGFLRICWLRCN